MTVKQDFAIGYGIVLSRALFSYAADHAGRLPNSFTDLANEGYVQRSTQLGWVLPAKAQELPDTSNPDYPLRHPEWFDVAWGVNLSEVDENGWIGRLERPVVRPMLDAAGFAGLGAEQCSFHLGRH